jgi:hypothetical protein
MFLNSIKQVINFPEFLLRRGDAMVLDPKHFDDMDDFCDFDEKLEATTDGDMVDSSSHHPLAWRRNIIERAVNNVKRAVEVKADVRSLHKKGALVFDEQANKFGRVIESRPGFLNLSLVGGGKLVRQDINPLDFVKENRQKLTLPEMAEKLVLSELEVIALFNQLELETESLIETKLKARHKSHKAPTKVVAVRAKESRKPEVKVALTHEPKASAKTPIKMAAKRKDSLVKKKVFASKETSISFTKLLPKGATTDPVVDPNGYIQQNFLMMSNRELAVATGLSEHTIRRKLGEWNLKRKDFVNKA